MPAAVITGRVVPPNNITRLTDVTFRAAETIIHGDDVVPAGSKSTYMLVDGRIPDGAQLVKNGRYIVLVKMEYSIQGMHNAHNAPIGAIQIGDGDEYDIAQLLNA